jgi:hypothetical protein
MTLIQLRISRLQNSPDFTKKWWKPQSEFSKSDKNQSKFNQIHQNSGKSADSVTSEFFNGAEFFKPATYYSCQSYSSSGTCSSSSFILLCTYNWYDFACLQVQTKLNTLISSTSSAQISTKLVQKNREVKIYVEFSE